MIFFVKDYCQLLDASLIPPVMLALDALMFALIGALLHIAEDGICGKVPIFTPHSKHGLKLFAVGSWKEYFFAALIILICLASRIDNIEELLRAAGGKIINR